jgi:hypothetical protein
MRLSSCRPRLKLRSSKVATSATTGTPPFTGTAGKTTSIVLPYGGSYGLGVVYAAKMIEAS